MASGSRKNSIETTGQRLSRSGHHETEREYLWIVVLFKKTSALGGTAAAATTLAYAAGKRVLTGAVMAVRVRGAG